MADCNGPLWTLLVTFAITQKTNGAFEGAEGVIEHLAPSLTNRAIIINMNVQEWLPLGAYFKSSTGSTCQEAIGPEIAPGVCCINYGRMAPYLEPKWLL